MTEGRNSGIYDGSPLQRQQLATIAGGWGTSFWPLDEVLLSLKIPGTFLLYRMQMGHWKGISLGRKQGDRVELFYIYVDPQLRGKGWGRQLLEDFLAHAFSLKEVESVFLEVRPSNQNARSLYERSGFVEAGCRKRYYRDGEDALIYSYTLPIRSSELK